MLSSVQSLFSFEEQGCRFIQSWKHVDTEILLVEDKWFLLNGIDTKGNINKARSESNIGIRNELDWTNLRILDLLISVSSKPQIASD